MAEVEVISVGEFEYQKKDIIGHGAFAMVFKGRNKKKPSVPVAIKIITKKNIAKSQQLLSKEIKILKELSDLHHENVVGLLDCKETTNHVYLVMEYCNGGDLADYLQAQGTLSEDTLSMFLRQIAQAMKALNAKGIVHRDLKPQNILLCHAGKPNPTASQMRLKIADFGFARFLQDGVMAATLCGSPMYMAPEVIMSLQYCAKADLWSIGTIVFQCLTGKAPFQAQTPQQLKAFYEKHANLVPNIPQGTSPELRDLLMKLLKRNAKDRIAFEDFFRHPFLRVDSKTLPSSPVQVPSRSHGFSSRDSTPGKHVATSPMSGNLDYSPPPPPAQLRCVLKEDVGVGVTGSSHEDAGFLKVDQEDSDHRPRSPSEDFVLVPDSIPHDPTGLSLKIAKAPLAEEELDVFSDQYPSLKNISVNSGDKTVSFKKDGQVNLGRPSSLPVQSPTNTSPTSKPIPVPSRAAAQHRASLRNSPTSPGSSLRHNMTAPANLHKYTDEHPLVRRTSEPRIIQGPDIGSLSPPSVQFTIGTPPNVSSPWRRLSQGTPPLRSSGTPPSVSGSPLRRSGGSSPRFSPLATGPSSLPTVNPGSLPTILGSPTKVPLGFEFPRQAELVNLAYAREGMQTDSNRNEYPRVNTDPGSIERGSSLLSQQLKRAGFGSPSQAAGAFGLASPRDRIGPYDRTSSLERERSSPLFRRSSAAMEASPPPSLMYAQSPPNMEGPITFVAPELSEETLMDDEHNEIMAKLHYILDLVECIKDLAKSRGSRLSYLDPGQPLTQSATVSSDQIPRFTEAQRLLEQLVLSVRVLHLLCSSLELARQELRVGRLRYSSSLWGVLQQMNKYYHQALEDCHSLHSLLGVTCKTPLSPQLLVCTADKLLYNCVIELCQTAALNEVIDTREECFRRYAIAQIILHSLVQQCRNQSDKKLLSHYKEVVEKRLISLQNEGVNPLS